MSKNVKPTIRDSNQPERVSGILEKILELRQSANRWFIPKFKILPYFLSLVKKASNKWVKFLWVKLEDLSFQCRWFHFISTSYERDIKQEIWVRHSLTYVQRFDHNFIYT